MKTELIYRSQDIIERDLIIQKLAAEGISVYGAGSQVNIVYPNTLILYWGGISAIFEGYRILVQESDVRRARDIIQDIVEVQKSWDKFSPAPIDHARKFYMLAFMSIALPFIPLPLALYHFNKARQKDQPIHGWLATTSFLFLIATSAGTLYWVIQL